MKAFLLSAGFGSRLKPLTNKIPKPLIKINNQTILSHWIKKLDAIFIETIFVNVHYKSELIKNYLDKKKYKKKISIIEENNLLGTGGSLINIIDQVKNEDLILLHADNFSYFDLNKLYKAHIKRPNNCLMTMLTFNSYNPSECGIVEVDENNIIKNFYEKVEDPPSNKANASIFILSSEFLNLISKKKLKFYDFAKDIIPEYLNRIFVYHTNDFYIDIGTKINLKKARTFANNYSLKSTRF